MEVAPGERAQGTPMKIKNRPRLDIEQWHDNPMGFSDEELEAYLHRRWGMENGCNEYEMNKILEVFWGIAGPGNTMAEDPERPGHAIIYTYDVERFADALFEGKSTFWD